jgi:hypothetical protein
MLNVEQLELRLTNAVTNYDRRESTKRGYNHYSLAQYLAAVGEVIGEVRQGVPIETALSHFFCDRILAVLTREVQKC